jgi:hypothetical protein
MLTPYVAGSASSPDFLERIWDVLVQNVERDMSGRALLNELTPEKLAGDQGKTRMPVAFR